MLPSQRENMRYANGAGNPIEEEEGVMFSLLPRESGRLLDIGCGVGSISLELQKKGFDVTGIDFSEVAIEKAKERGVSAHVVDVDKEGLSAFSDNHFDVVWAGDVVEHVFDPLFLFAEVKRVLKPTGVFLLTIPNDFDFQTRCKLFLSGKSIQSDVYRKLKQCKHHTFFSWELLEYMLAENHFSIIEYFSLYKSPITKKRNITTNMWVGKNFGNIFIISVKRVI